MTLDEVIAKEIDAVPDKLLRNRNRTRLKVVLSKAVTAYLSSQKIYLHREDKAIHRTCKCADCAVTRKELEQAQKTGI